MVKNVLEFNSITIKFKNMEQPMLIQSSLKIDNSMQVALIGPSGIGKTSLLNTLFKNDFLNEGHILFNKKDLAKFDNKEYKKFVSLISLLSQKPNLIFEESVYNNIKRSLTKYHNWFYKITGFLTQQQRTEIYQILDKLGILNKAHTVIAELSGGQQQRVEIAKNFINKSQIILADEPTSSLDIKTAQNIISQLKDLAKTNNAILIVSMHDIELVKINFTHYISIMNQQAILKPIEALTKQEIDRIYHHDQK